MQCFTVFIIKNLKKISMRKLAILNYFTGNIAIVSVSEELVKYYNGNLEDLLSENSLLYTNTCNWMELKIDNFGNFKVQSEILNERKS